MSEMETHIGKLVPIMNLDGNSLEENAREVCSRLGFELGKYHDSWLECLHDEGYEHVYIDGDIIYEKRDEYLDSYGFAKATKNEDGSIDYCISWYNGGGSMDEVLEAAIKDDSAN